MALDNQIGKVHVLHNVAFPNISDRIDRFVVITVIEEKQVSGEYNPDKTYTGFRAKGWDDRFYVQNWSHFPDYSSDPYWAWQLEYPEDRDFEKDPMTTEEANDTMWHDVTRSMPKIPARPKFIDELGVGAWVEWCPIHQDLYESYCFFCKHAPEAGIPEKPQNWKGWF